MTETKHLLTLADLTCEEFWGYVDRALAIKEHPSGYIRALYERTLLMIFEAPSLRTRLSFETAMTQLHGHAINYYTVHSPWGAGKESIEDVARTLSRYCDAVCARIFDHDELVRLAQNATVPVINAMTNSGHPCQVLGDYLTIVERLGRRDDLRIAYLGDAKNNVTYSLMRAARISGSSLKIACPKDARYHPDPAIVAEIETIDPAPGAAIEIHTNPVAAVRDANVVYTDSWMSYRVPADEREQRHRDLDGFRVDAELMADAPDDAIFMHCLPAMRGDEVTAEIIDGPQSVVFDQAENRLHMEKAVLLQLVDAPIAT